MEHQTTNCTVFLIFAGAAVFSTIALYLRQSLLVAYMLFGVVFGPWGLKVIPDIDLIHKIDNIGVIFLMFLLGLQLQPQNLLRLISKTAWVTLTSSLIFFIVGFVVGYWYGYSLTENLVIGACMMFSSTIVSLKLLPNDVVKRQPLSEMMISILLLQDLIAILVLLSIEAAKDGKLDISEVIILVFALPAVCLFVFLAERLIIKKIFVKFSGVQEYVFLVAIAWCFGIAQLADSVGFSYEIGAFVAGLALAASSSPVVFYITNQLKPLRDFFLVLFFFIIGASFNLRYFKVIVIPALILTAIFVLLKPLIFRFLLYRVNECKNIAWELGVRLGQLSEFSLLVIFCAGQNGLVNDSVACLTQAVTMMMFIISSYLVVIRYPSFEKAPESPLTH